VCANPVVARAGRAADHAARLDPTRWHVDHDEA
jgi:hypothetical protein